MSGNLTEGRKRLRYLDWTKALGIMMVTYGHVLPLEDGVNAWMSLFKLPLFYVVAGYLMGLRENSLKKSVGQFTLKLLRSLGWPYLTFSLLTMPIRWWFKFLKGGDLLAVVKNDLFCTVTLQGISVLWFLPSLFFAELLFFLIQKSRSRVLIALTFLWPLLFGFYARGWYDAAAHPLAKAAILVLGKGIIAAWFVQVGYYAPPLVNRLPKGWFRPLLGAALSALTLAMVPHAGHINFYNIALGTHPLLFHLGGLTGTFGALLLFQALDTGRELGFLSYWGTNSLLLMTTQRGMRIINIATGGVKEISQLHEVVCPRYYMETLSILFITLLMAYGAIELIHRHFPFLIRPPEGKTRAQRGS